MQRGIKSFLTDVILAIVFRLKDDCILKFKNKKIQGDA